MPGGKVAGVEPSTREGLCCRIWLREVTRHHDVASHYHFSERLTIPGYVLHVLVHDPHQVSGHVTLPLPGQESRLLRCRQRLPCLPGLISRDRRIGLGETIDVNGLEVELLQAREQGWGGRRASHGGGYGSGEAVGLRMVYQPDVDGWGRIVMPDPFVLKQTPDQVTIHLPEADMGAPNRGHGPGEAPPIAVEHRYRPQMDRLPIQAGFYDISQGVQVGASVRVHDALWPARRSRGVVDRNGFFLVLQSTFTRLRGPRSDISLVGIARCACVFN